MINEFDELAERILLSMLRSPFGLAQDPAAVAVELADEFLLACRERHQKLKNLDGLTPEEVRLLEQNQIISCIKSVRERSGMNLKEAKTHVDEMRAQHGFL